MTPLTLDTLRQAHERIKPYIHRTPVLSSTKLNEEVGAEVYFKCENFQKVGAFKARGACNAVLSLSDEAAKRGVVTHSSGNHGAALAWAARLRGIPATVVVPRNAPAPKLKAIAGYGATIVMCEPTVASREGTVAELIGRHGYELIHPFDDDRVIAGQSTAALELLEQQPDLQTVIAPTGGGGLLSGTALAVKLSQPGVKVYGAEPQGADDAYRSYTTGTLVREQTPETVCDGLRTTLADRTFAIIRQYVDGIGVADDAAVVSAMQLIWSYVKIIVEPSCCPPLAALRTGSLSLQGQRVGIILTGGNVDLNKLPWVSH
ncbi:MAG: pyridoxal-phosphate dependent enzyme [Gemmatales bacterium]